MSIFNLQKRGSSELNDAVSQLRTAITERGTEWSNKSIAGAAISLENLSEAQQSEVSRSAAQISDTLKASFESIQELGGRSDLTEQQLDAGIMVAMAAGNLVDYAEAGYRSRAAGSANVPVVSAESFGIAGSFDYREEVALEAFDERELEKMLPYSIAFNIRASRQDDFSEAFYPTTVVSPEVGGMDISIHRTLVFNALHRSPTGAPADFNKRPLLEATVDASILADQSTALVPYKREDGSADQNFVDEAAVGTETVKVGRVGVRTAPLKLGRDIGLIGLSQHPELLGMGVMDHTDAIDARINLENLYVRVGGAEGSVVRFPTLRLPRSGFNKTIEGQYREMGLQFRNSSLLLDGDTLAVDGSAPAALTVLRDQGYSVRLAVNVDGSLNTEEGVANVYCGRLQVAQVFNDRGIEVSTTEGPGKSIVDALVLEAIGYDLKAARTNSNRRTRGLLLTTDSVTERYAIPLAAPLSAPSPNGSNRDARDLDSLIAAARVRNSNNAVTAMLNYAETLRAYKANELTTTVTGVPEIEGMGRYVVRPFYEERTLDMAAEINSLSSKDRAEDIAALLVNAVRDVSYRMYRDSRYQMALDASSMGSKDVTLVIGTDPVINRHLIVAGDTRTFGAGFTDHQVVTSWDQRVANKIIMTFVRKGMEGAPDALSFGTHAWMPELVSTMQVTRDGATYTEPMVQPRTRHINNLPILAVINVIGLEDVLAKSVSFRTSADAAEAIDSDPAADSTGDSTTAA